MFDGSPYLPANPGEVDDSVHDAIDDLINGALGGGGGGGGGGSSAESWGDPYFDSNLGEWVQRSSRGSIRRLGTGPEVDEPVGNVNPADRNGDGLDDTTNMALGVYAHPSSPSGYYYPSASGELIPVLPNGAPYSGPDLTPGAATARPPTWTGYGPQGQGTYYLDGPNGTPGTFVGATQGPAGTSRTTWTGYGPQGQGTYYLDGPNGAPGTFIGRTTNPTTTTSGGGGSSGGGGGGGSSAPVRDWAGEQAAQNEFEAAQAEANRQFQWEMAAAKTEADRAIAEMNFAVQLRRLGLDEKQFGVDAAETFGRLASSTDPLAFASFLHAGGGNIMNSLSAGNDALSPAALLPAARALQAMRGLGSGGGFGAGGGFGSGSGGFPAYHSPTAGGGGGIPSPAPAAPSPATPPVVGELSPYDQAMARFGLRPGEDPNVPRNVPSWMPPQGPVEVAGPTFEQLNGGPMTFTADMARTFNTQMPGYTTQMPAIGSLWDPNGGGWTAQPGTTTPPPPPQEPVPGVWGTGTTTSSASGGPDPSTMTAAPSGGATLVNGQWVQNPLTTRIPMLAHGTMRGLGYVNHGMMGVGDAPGPNPTANGARPEIIVNPTNAPIGVIPTPQARRMMRGLSAPRFAEGTWYDPYKDVSPVTTVPVQPATSTTVTSPAPSTPVPSTAANPAPAPAPAPASTVAPSSLSSPALTNNYWPDRQATTAAAPTPTTTPYSILQDLANGGGTPEQWAAADPAQIAQMRAGAGYQTIQMAGRPYEEYLAQVQDQQRLGGPQNMVGTAAWSTAYDNATGDARAAMDAEYARVNGLIQQKLAGTGMQTTTGAYVAPYSVPVETATGAETTGNTAGGGGSGGATGGGSTAGGGGVPTGGGYGVTPLTDAQLGVGGGDIPTMAEVLGLRQGTQVPALNYYDIGFNDVGPTMQQLYFSGLQGRYGVPQQDAINEWQRYRMRGLSGSNLGLGV